MKRLERKNEGKMDKLQVEAYAKINIGLDVIKKLENGYHEVKMIMQTISLHDTLTLERMDTSGIVLETDSKKLPKGSENLAFKAAKLLFDEFCLPGGLNIFLQKKIPIAAGMAGGSADAAAVFRGVNQLFDLGLKKEELMKRAVALGADIPYCISGGTCLAEGIGERLTKVAPIPECCILAAKPKVSVSTKWVYENLHAESIKEHPDIDTMLRSIEDGSLEELAKHMGNVLQYVTYKRYPVVLEMIEKMEELGALKAMMSGSGPTVFGLFKTKGQMRKAYEGLKKHAEIEDLFLCGIQPEYERKAGKSEWM